jgi:DNA-binding beta-propeller fold protein YncE
MSELTYHIARELPLGSAGNWDFITVDSTGHRLFIARGDRVMVVDPVTGRLLGEIGELRGAQHVALVPRTDRGFITSGGDGKVWMFDLQTLKVLSIATATADADVIVYDPASDRVCSFNGTAKSATVIDPHTGARVASIPLTGSPEFAAVDGRGHLYVNLASRGEVAELDTKSLKITRHWSIAPCKDPSGLALDVAHQRVFSVCSNRTMAISEAAADKLITTLPIGGSPDGVVFDPTTGDALASNGSGTITVVHEDSPSSFRAVQTLATLPGARSIALDPSTHQICTVAMKPGTARSRRGKATGVFTLLIIER